MLGKEVKTKDFKKNKENKLKIISLLKYKNQKEEYIVYILDNGIGYGKAFIKENCIVCLEPKIEKRKIIEELINRLINEEPLDDFHLKDISFINQIELIGKDFFELSKKDIEKINHQFFPKKESIKKKESSYSGLFFIFFLIIICILLVFQFLTKETKENQKITCIKETKEEFIKASLKENIEISLQNHLVTEIKTTKTYYFRTDDDYQKFQEEGLIWKYMQGNNEGGYKLDKNNKTFMTITKEEITKETEEKEILNIYQKEKGYQCTIETVGE